MLFNSSKIINIKENNEHLFYAYQEDGINYLLIPDGFRRNIYEKSAMHLVTSLNVKIQQDIEHFGELPKSMLEEIENISIGVPGYTAINMRLFTGIMDDMNLFNKSFFPKSFISISGTIQQYIFGTWFKHFPYGEVEIIDITDTHLNIEDE